MAASCVALFALCPGPAPAAETKKKDKPDQSEVLKLRKIFHIAGIPGIRRNARGDMTLSTRTLVYWRNDKESVIVPYERIHRIQLQPTSREYAKTTYALVLAAGAPGALMLLKKRKMDAFSVDFDNERGGRMAMVLQVPRGDGARCKQWLSRFGVRVEEPAVSQWLEEKSKIQ
jgi:hypothetical protein